MAWQGADWDGKASSGGGKWQRCPTELRYAPKDVSSAVASCKGFSRQTNEHAQLAFVPHTLRMWYALCLMP